MARAKTEKIKVTVAVDGLTESVRAFQKYGRDAAGELRDAAQREVDKIAPAMVQAMAGDGGPSALVATSIRSKRDRYPVIAAGGSKAATKHGRRRVNAGELFFGAEFGGRGRPTTQQFRPWRGTTGYAFYPTLRARTSDLIDGYKNALAELAHRWAGRSHG